MYIFIPCPHFLKNTIHTCHMYFSLLCWFQQSISWKSLHSSIYRYPSFLIKTVQFSIVVSISLLLMNIWVAPVLSITNSGIKNRLLHMSFSTFASVSLVRSLYMKLLSQKINAYVVLLGIAKFSSIRVVPFSVPTSNIQIPFPQGFMNIFQILYCCQFIR